MRPGRNNLVSGIRFIRIVRTKFIGKVLRVQRLSKIQLARNRCVTFGKSLFSQGAVVELPSTIRELRRLMVAHHFLESH